jgi:hypothetical protein
MESETEYQEFRLLGNEVSFDVDVSKLGCGLNGALYFVSVRDFFPLMCDGILELIYLA